MSIVRHFMIKIFYTIILAVFLFQNGNSQFLVTQQHSTPDYFSTLITQNQSDRFSVLVYNDVGNYSLSRPKYQILSYNFNGQLAGAVNLFKGFSPISFPLRLNKNYYWAFTYNDTLLNNPSNQDIYLFKLDSNFNYIKKCEISSISTNNDEYASNIIEIKNKLYVATKNYNTNTTKIFKLDTLFNKLDSVNYAGVNVWELSKYNDGNIILSASNFPTSSPFGNAQKVIIDTAFINTQIYSLDSLTFVNPGCLSKVGIYHLVPKIFPVTKYKYIVLGRYPIVYNNNCDSKDGLVNSVLDNNNNVIHTTLIKDSINGVSFIDNTNYTYFKSNNIFTVSSIGHNWQIGATILQPQNTSILVCKLDTMANLVWKKSYGGDMYYRPVSIIQTLDSGLLVSGIRYNDAETSYPGVGQSFILRLDKNGDLVSVGIKENNASNFTQIKCFPNPSKDVIYFDAPFMQHYELLIYDVFGRLVYQNNEYENLKSISTQFLSSGAYYYKIKLKDNYVSGKFIRE